MERFVDLIHDKKNGKELSDESICGMIEGFTKGHIPDYQMSAMLMAICYEGLNDRELTTMTLAMRDSAASKWTNTAPAVSATRPPLLSGRLRLPAGFRLPR